jgi:hypothetical protein
MSHTRSAASPRAMASTRLSISARASEYCVSPGVTTHSTGGASSGANKDAREARRELSTRDFYQTPSLRASRAAIPRPSARPTAHKFTRANDFSALVALSRNFFGLLLSTLAPFCFASDGGRKSAKVKRIFRPAKRRVSLRVVSGASRRKAGRFSLSGYCNYNFLKREVISQGMSLFVPPERPSQIGCPQGKWRTTRCVHWVFCFGEANLRLT